MTNAGVETAEDPILPEALRRLPLGPVMPLIKLLDSFKPNSTERALTWKEDEMAIFVLKSLVPKDSPEVVACVENFCDPNFRKRRTLAEWYHYVPHFAKHLASGRGH